MADKIYQVIESDVIIDWKKLKDSKVLTDTELEIFYKLVEKIEANQGGNVKWLR